MKRVIRRGAAELRPFEYISQYQTTAWGQAPTGLIVCGYQFSDRHRSDLAALFTRTTAELR
ncbi:MAG: hypothetical protein DMG09_29625 [Acidobacteria bacterium]|nr:MAG: hypothetical protein DMG09_29625 [Acidobacteriota bacterium]